jgi:methionyl-tRNA formyltransferase
VIKAAFFGTPPAAVPSLAALATVAEIQLVVTRPDKPRGRSGTPIPPAVAEAAHAFGFPLRQPVKASEVIDMLAGIDVAVVVAYGQILPADLIAVPAAGFVNVHFSLLPRWRGAAPVAAAIAAGDETTGVCLMQIDEGLDTGPVFAKLEIPIGRRDTTGALTARLAAVGARLLGDTISNIVSGYLRPEPQDDSRATVAPRRTPAGAQITTALEADEAARLVRASNPSPGSWMDVGGTRVKVWETTAVAGAGPTPGTFEMTDRGLELGLTGGTLLLGEVQPAGKQRMSGPAWANGWHGPQKLA